MTLLEHAHLSIAHSRKALLQQGYANGPTWDTAIFQSLIREKLFCNRAMLMVLPGIPLSFNRSFAKSSSATPMNKLASVPLPTAFNRSFAKSSSATDIVLNAGVDELGLSIAQSRKPLLQPMPVIGL